MKYQEIIRFRLLSGDGAKLRVCCWLFCPEMMLKTYE